MADLSKCRSCGASIVWCVSASTGKRAPIDAEASAEGNILIARDGRYLILAPESAGEHAGKLHTNHFATCTSASQWRTKGK